MNDNPAYIDALTGLHNRLHFESKLKEEVRRGRRDNAVFSLAVLDLDYFKLCNDMLGTRGGDQILKKVGEVLLAKRKPDHSLSRLEGDEFALLLPGLDLVKAEAFAQELRKAVSKARYPGSELFDELFPNAKLTASIGLTAFHPQMQHEFDLMAWADYALYRAKRHGRDRIVVQEGPPHGADAAKKPLALFEGLANLLPTHRPVAEKLQRVVELVREWLAGDVCSLYLLEGKELVLRATDGLQAGSVGKVRMKTNEGLTGLVIETMTMVCARDAQSHPRYKYFPETGESHLGSYLGVPILFEYDALGVLVLQTKVKQDFSEEEIKVLKAIAGFLGSFLKNLPSATD